VVATNSAGSGSTYSNLSAQVAAKSTPPVNTSLPVIVGTAAVGRGSVSASGGGGGNSKAVPVTSLVAHPDHLLISDVKYSPSTFGNPGGVFTMRVRVELEGTTKVVSGALVKVTGIPYNWVVQAPETPTGSDGWATLQIKTTKSLPHSGALVMQVRARGPGNSDEDILGGFSTRRLVQISLH
jgi:hypothetical protein